jgi:hypothetical protein
VILGVGALQHGQAQVDAVPPPPGQLRADCDAITYASDVRVCATPRLAELDGTMASRLAHAGGAALSPSSPWVESQSDWFTRRSLCAMRTNHDACLAAAYAERIAELEVMAGSAEGEWRDCMTGAPLAGARLFLGSNGAGAVMRSGALEVVGLWRFDASIWRPFVAIELGDRGVTLSLPDGRQLAC